MVGCLKTILIIFSAVCLVLVFFAALTGSINLLTPSPDEFSRSAFWAGVFGAGLVTAYLGLKLKAGK